MLKINLKSEYKKLYVGKNMTDYEISSEIDFVIEMLTGVSSTDILLGKEIHSPECEKIFDILKERIETNRPLQQIIGKAYFAGNIYRVNNFTLIPRPETEFLVDRCRKEFSKEKPVKILDMGTGTGCIAIELANYYNNAEIVAVDICQQALDIARKNADDYNVLNKISFFVSDVFQEVQGKFDIIVSNPPYIPLSMPVQQDVYDFEPHSALFAEDNGLYFYKKIISEAKKYLNRKALLAFEVGFNQGEKVAEFFGQNGYVNMSFTQDCDGVNRVVSANFI